MFCCNVYFDDIYKTDYAEIVYQQSSQTGVDPALVFAIIKEESGFNANAVSSVGAIGLMQIMPRTASGILGENINIETLKEEYINIQIGCDYVKYLINKFHNIELSIIAYNAGEGNVFNWINNGKIDLNYNTPFAQTNAYLKKVMDSYRVYSKILNK